MGAQLRVYTQKIKSAQSTKKITKAMELIAASRIQKALARVHASTPYARALTRAVSAVATYSNEAHPLTVEVNLVDMEAGCSPGKRCSSSILGATGRCRSGWPGRASS